MTDSDARAGPPAVAVFDVNETLSDLSGLAPRFEEAGVDSGLLPALLVRGR